MAKRSPILGYNHNVRYRGLVFHVQTEDSGVLSPHLFTHLFHEGVIVSTRKLVYDAGANVTRMLFDTNGVGSSTDAVLILNGDQRGFDGFVL